MTSVLIRERHVWGSETKGIRPCEVRAGNWSDAATSQEYLRHQDLKERNFPGGLVVKNLPCNAGGTGSIPCWGTKIPRAAGQLSPRYATKEACVRQRLSHRKKSPRPTAREACVQQSWPTAAKKNSRRTWILGCAMDIPQKNTMGLVHEGSYPGRHWPECLQSTSSKSKSACRAHRARPCLPDVYCENTGCSLPGFLTCIIILNSMLLQGKNTSFQLCLSPTFLFQMS